MGSPKRSGARCVATAFPPDGVLQEREEYLSPVGFATEPAGQRSKWFGRVVLALLVAGIGWILVNRVIAPPTESTPTTPIEQLPGPI